MFPTSLDISLPDWVGEIRADTRCESDEQKVAFAIELARRNSTSDGGPFGAAVFHADTGELIAPGVNVVTRCGCSVAHAEIVALSMAQKALQTHDLSQTPCELATSTEPCAMCLGAIPWSGVCAVLCGAREEDAESVGFDEGDKPANWQAALQRRNIRVVQDILRDDARSVLQEYHRNDGPIY